MCGIFFLLKSGLIDFTKLNELFQSLVLHLESDMIQAVKSTKGYDPKPKSIPFYTSNVKIADLYRLIQNRGPDSVISFQGSMQNGITTYDNITIPLQAVYEFYGISSVMKMRSDELIKQPLIDTSKCFLMFNGEIFGINESRLQQKYEYFDAQSIAKYNACNNDSKFLFEILLQSSIILSKNRNIAKYIEELNQIMNYTLEADYAFIYFDYINQIILVSKDLFGKRSLLTYMDPTSKSLIFSSVPIAYTDSYEFPSNTTLALIYNKDQIVPYYSCCKKPSDYRFSKEPCYQTLCLQSIEKSLTNAVARRLIGLPYDKIGILFSGGIDSLLLSVLTHFIYPKDREIDLITVGMAHESPDMVTSVIAYSELKILFPERKWNLIICDLSSESIKAAEPTINSLIHPQNTLMDLSIGTSLYFASLSEGKKCIIDDPLDILKTAENFKGKFNDAGNTAAFLEQLKFKLGEPFTSKSRSLFSGLGADEIFGGYSRHMILYIKGNSWETIEKEMKMDLDRLSLRNCGRDDRIIGSLSKEARFPYLDSTLLEELSKYETHCFFTEKSKSFSKIVIRQLLKQYGFKISHEFSKKAIQFGTRIAHTYNVNKYGSHRKAKGWNKMDD